MSEHTERKLAAVVSVDIVGYSRLMGVDEVGTLAAFRAHREELIDGKIAAHGGRVVKTMGDGLLLEFPSVVNATKCAIEIQTAMAERNFGIGEDRRIQFRIGINLGDVIIEGDDILGDGVNIAARLQEIAEPGGIAISRRVFEDVQDRLEVQFTDFGEQKLKNIARATHVWRWTPNGQLAVAAAPGAREPQTLPLPLPDKPSIAVLPFTNMSGDPDQEYFADGITEDIITALSKFRWFFVIARNSTFTYKGRSVDVRDVGRELGVRYVLEGSVRKAGNRVRITAQLIDAETANHVWAERYDRNLEDIFELQDEITATISGAIEPELAVSEQERALRKPTENLGAWDLFQRGVACLWRRQDRGGPEEAVALLHQAIALDPGFGRAYGYLAFGACLLLFYERADNRDAVLRQGMADANRALAIDRRDYFAHHAAGRLCTLSGDHRGAVRALETSVDINPNFAQGYVGLAEAHVYGGDPKRALDYCDQAFRLSPNDPMAWDMLHYKASAYIRLNEFDLAIETFENVCEYPTVQFVPPATLAALYVMQGREEEGRRALAQARKLEPSLTVEVMKKVYGVTKERPGSRTSRLLDGFRTLGVPEN